MPIVREYIGTGDKAIFRTLEKMQQFAQEDSQSDVIRKIGTEIIRNCGGDKMCRAKQAFQYIIKKVKYIYDDELAKKLIPGIKNAKSKEVVVRPSKLLTSIHEGDCDDMATSLAALTIFLRIPTFFKVIDWKPDTGFSHVYLILMIDGKEIPADPVKKIFNWEKKPIKRSAQCEINSGECKTEFLESNIKGMSGLADSSACIKETYTRVNYNSGCIEKACYSNDYVANVINTYSKMLQDGKIKTYDREKAGADVITEIENILAKELNEKEPGRVKAVLYNMYYGIVDGLKNNNDVFKDCEILIKKKMSKWIYFFLGATAFGTAGWFVIKNKNEHERQKTMRGLNGLKRQIQTQRKRRVRVK